jgi:hypothetical protein
MMLRHRGMMCTHAVAGTHWSVLKVHLLAGLPPRPTSACSRDTLPACTHQPRPWQHQQSNGCRRCAPPMTAAYPITPTSAPFLLSHSIIPSAAGSGSPGSTPSPASCTAAAAANSLCCCCCFGCWWLLDGASTKGCCSADAARTAAGCTCTEPAAIRPCKWCRR